MFPIRHAIVRPLLATLSLLNPLTLSAADQELLDILLANGAITQAQYNQLMMRNADSGPAEVLNAVQAPVRTERPRGTVRTEDLDQRLAASEARLTTLESRANRSRWSESLQLRGYVQTRYTTLLDGDTGIDLWSDRSVGDDTSLRDADKNFLIRRARLVFSGDIGDRLSLYLQPDLASSAGTTGNVAQVRDAYGDIYLTTNRVHRLRLGQSKVPFGFENMQSSSNRLTPDRNDALNSAVRDERDIGLFYYFTPAVVQERFNAINAAGLKHSGNYGMFGFGAYDGQGANRGDRNDNHHLVARVTYPWQLADGQYFEAGIQAYRGRYVVSTDAYRGADDVSRVPSVASEYVRGFEDQRVGVSFLLYPQPFGIQGEWNWGDSPALDPFTNQILPTTIDGGYLQAMWRFDTGLGTFIPFAKWQTFDGANKAETNAPRNDVNDFELGLEWLVARELELTAVWHHFDRTNLVTGNRAGRPDYAQFDADALRVQVQFNY